MRAKRWRRTLITIDESFDRSIDNDTALVRLAGLRAVYVEDNSINVQLMETIFEDIADSALYVAGSGEDCLENVEAFSPDVILMDIGLPGIDGVETTRLLKKKFKTATVPVIAISAAAMKSDLERAENAGFFAYLTKPINIPDTLRVIIKAVR